MTYAKFFITNRIQKVKKSSYYVAFYFVVIVRPVHSDNYA